jgi:hypothetical protein
MPAGSVDAAVQADLICSSPPYEGSLATNVHTIRDIPGIENHSHRKAGQVFPSEVKQAYGTTEGNIGNDTGNTFWQASKLIVAQAYQILKPGGVAIWVTKRFVRGGEIQEFSQDWARLCHSQGFEPLEWIHASLVKRDEQPGLFGEPVVKTKSRKSFFRRLHEAKRPDLSIDWEDVIILRKPGGDGGTAEAVISSPPYSGNEKSDYRAQDENGLDRDERRGYRQGQGCFRGSENYGDSPGNLGNLKPGTLDDVL